MSRLALAPLDRPGLAPLPITPRLRTQLVYFASPRAAEDAALAEHEFFFAEADVEKWLDEGVMYLVSPLDTANMTEVELSEEQEAFLHWLKAERVRHVRLLEG